MCSSDSKDSWIVEHQRFHASSSIKGFMDRRASKIGRAAGRERVYISVVAEALIERQVTKNSWMEDQAMTRTLTKIEKHRHES